MLPTKDTRPSMILYDLKQISFKLGGMIVHAPHPRAFANCQNNSQPFWVMKARILGFYHKLETFRKPQMVRRLLPLGQHPMLGQVVARVLIEEALARGTSDNVTCVVVRSSDFFQSLGPGCDFFFKTEKLWIGIWGENFGLFVCRSFDTLEHVADGKGLSMRHDATWLHNTFCHFI